MKTTLQIALLFILISSCSRPQTEIQNTELPPISTVYDSFYEGSLALDPLMGNFLGINRYYDTIPNNLTIAFREKEELHYQTHLDKIKQYNRELLSESEQVNYDIIVWLSKNKLETDPAFVRYFPIDQFKSLNLTIAQFASGSSAQPFVTVEDYENWIKRLECYTIWLDTAMVNMKKGISLGYVHPKSIVKKVIPQFEQMATTQLEDHLFFMPVKNMPNEFSEEEKIKIDAKYRQMVKEEIIPRYQALTKFFQTDYLESSRSTSGIGQLPSGSDYYKNQIEYWTTTTLPADSIFNLGMSEVARIRNEMEKVKIEVGFEGDLLDFFKQVRTNKDLMPYSDPQEVLDNFNNIHERMRPQLEKLFTGKPKTPFIVKRTEAFREKSASAQYNPGSPDGSRAGTFYVPIPEVEAYNVYADEDLFLHEAIPGHHYQVMLALENESIPSFRKFTMSGAYVEGWALYTESLGKELGLYTDPYQYFGMLSAEMHRAIRLVVDVGLHHKGWTREEAIAFSLKNEAESEASIISEIERYMILPAQALSYKIGQLTILRLRQEAEHTLAEKFNIKEFHSIILDNGDMPLSILQNRVRNWILETRK
tara:strand:- start:2697 stop:4475 length:1779 start_codon:yes stop_codon:yes gene_type:complete